MTLKENAYIELKRLIMENELHPGQFLSERALTERLNMSRTPIRSALERLEAEGFVKQSPQQGVLVLETSIKKAMDIYDLRIALESHIVGKLAETEFSVQDIAWFEHNLELQKLNLEKMDQVQFTALDSEYHRKLSEVYGNLEIIQTIEKIQSRLYQIALTVLRKDLNRIQIAYLDHRNIFDFIVANNKAQAVELIVNHLEYGKLILIS